MFMPIMRCATTQPNAAALQAPRAHQARLDDVWTETGDAFDEAAIRKLLAAFSD